METTPPMDKLEFFVATVLTHIVRSNVSYDKAYRAVASRYHVPRWLAGTFYKVGYYAALYYHGLVWLASRNGYPATPVGAAAYFRRLGFSVRRLRRVLDEETRGLGLVARLSYRYGYPRHLVKTLLRHMYYRELEKMLRELNKRRLWIRINTLKARPVEVEKCLLENNVGFEQDTDLDYMLRVTRPRWLRPSTLPCVMRGEAVPQDKASALVVEALMLKPGESLIDACSAPGVKLGLAYMLTRGDTWAVAVDAAARRAAQIPRVLGLQGVPRQRYIVVNGDSGWISYSHRFDAAMVDAPCSGLGAVPGDPAVKITNRREGKIQHYTRVQYSILRNTLRYADRVVYSVCSIHPAEGEGVVKRVVEEGLAVLEKPRIPGGKPYPGYGRASYDAVRLYPHIHGTQGFYIAVLRPTGRGG